MKSRKYVIVGGGTTAGYAASEFAAMGIAKGDLCIVSAEKILPMNRPPFSKHYLTDGNLDGDIIINDQNFYDKNGIEVILETCVRRADLGRRRLDLDNGETIKYEKMLIATGSAIKHLGVPGKSLQNVFYLRNHLHSDKIREKAKNSREVIVIGGGFISCETASVLSRMGLRVTMVIAQDQLLSHFTDKEIGLYFDRLYKSHGIELLYSNRVSAMHGMTEVEEVELLTGRKISTDFVVVGIGVEPNTKIFQDTGLSLQKGILVNEYCETNIRGIYAAGDVAEFPDRLFRKMRIMEHWDNACQQGRVAARNMAGNREQYTYVPYFFSDFFELSYDFIGDNENTDSAVTRGDLLNGDFSRWWFMGDKLAAAFIMASRPQEERDLARQWISSKAQVDRDQISKADHPLLS
jgi:NADPH-dependent 2,4-dienoyl-CoA reductase/sulfur reductase-like enzyme